MLLHRLPCVSDNSEKNKLSPWEISDQKGAGLPKYNIKFVAEMLPLQELGNKYWSLQDVLLQKHGVVNARKGVDTGLMIVSIELAVVKDQSSEWRKRAVLTRHWK